MLQVKGIWEAYLSSGSKYLDLWSYPLEISYTIDVWEGRWKGGGGWYSLAYPTHRVCKEMEIVTYEIGSVPHVFLIS